MVIIVLKAQVYKQFMEDADAAPGAAGSGLIRSKQGSRPRRGLRTSSHARFTSQTFEGLNQSTGERSSRPRCTPAHSKLFYKIDTTYHVQNHLWYPLLRKMTSNVTIVDIITGYATQFSICISCAVNDQNNIIISIDRLSRVWNTTNISNFIYFQKCLIPFPWPAGWKNMLNRME